MDCVLDFAEFMGCLAASSLLQILTRDPVKWKTVRCASSTMKLIGLCVGSQRMTLCWQTQVTPLSSQVWKQLDELLEYNFPTWYPPMSGSSANSRFNESLLSSVIVVFAVIQLEKRNYKEPTCGITISVQNPIRGQAWFFSLSVLWYFITPGMIGVRVWTCCIWMFLQIGMEFRSISAPLALLQPLKPRNT